MKDQTTVPIGIFHSHLHLRREQRRWKIPAWAKKLIALAKSPHDHDFSWQGADWGAGTPDIWGRS